ncbi:MAG: AMP-binding protein [Bradyrhizobium sp.]|uniref:AMP-binding protein n=1 Tax=Bradyrhizobium sp. TaxID=376 RepID=UPI0025BF4806|nr:AMP-binding protein [Bradyrhizobium sp.]MBI5261849.1 AMP-binding protein [Bradyrhizobium sp.]
MGLRDFSLADVIARNARLFPDRAAVVIGDRRVSNAAYRDRVVRLAAGLARAGVSAGDRVAMLSHNNLEFVDVYGAMAWLGAILVPINWRLSADEIAYIVSDAAPKAVIADQAHQEALIAACSEIASIQLWIGVGGAIAPYRPIEEICGDGETVPPAVAASAPFVMFHTAAVSGQPRGALLTQSGLIASSVQMINCWSLTERDTALCVLPLFHLAGLTLLLGCQHAGGTAVILPRFDAAEAVRAVRAEKVTVLSEFAPILGSMLDATKHPGDLASLRVVTGLDTPETIARFERACPDARFWVAFGQSETSGLVTAAPFRDRPGSAGRPMFLSQVAVVDDLDRPVPAGETGEIVVRGPGVFEGYWNCPEDTKATFRNGWHHTGDNGAFDADGYLFYKGRTPAKELIKPGGENVYPAEVEAALLGHPALLEAVVFGVPDAEWGEAVKAVCALKPGASATPKEIVDFVAGRIARYKRPKHILLTESLPKTAAGAIDRTRAKETFRDG